MAGVQGLEPRYSGPKPDVLPLDDTPIICFVRMVCSNPADSILTESVQVVSILFPRVIKY